MDTDTAVIAHLKAFYGRDVSSIDRFRAGLVNESYRVVFGSGEMGVIRISRHRDIQKVLFESEVLRELEQHAFPSPRIITALGGSLITHMDGRPVLVYSYIQGEIKDTLTPVHLFNVGRLLGRKHQILSGFVPSVQKPTWEPSDLKVLFHSEKESFLRALPGSEDVILFCETHLREYEMAHVLPKGVTHQDVKRENIVVYGDEISGIIDFDNAYYGTYLYDLMTTVLWEGMQDGELRAERVHAIISGYLSERPFSDSEKSHIVDAFRHRVVREVFISPYAAVTNREVALERAKRFMAFFETFGVEEEKLLRASIT